MLLRLRPGHANHAMALRQAAPQGSCVARRREGTAGMIPTSRYPQIEVASIAEVRHWLAANHRQTTPVWLVRYRKTVPEKFIDRLDLLDELLCYGWIDGIARKLDEARTMQLIAPRRQQAWAQSYKDRVERLAAAGRMAAPGNEAIVRSKLLGMWDATAAVDQLLVSDDLRSRHARRPRSAVLIGRCRSPGRNTTHTITVASGRKAPISSKRCSSVSSTSLH